MHFCAVHLAQDGGMLGDEEVYVIVPGGSKTAMAVPLDALPRFLALLDQAIGGNSRPRCPQCGAAIPDLAVCPEADCDTGDPG
jgi:hypothetical protein